MELHEHVDRWTTDFMKKLNLSFSETPEQKERRKSYEEKRELEKREAWNRRIQKAGIPEIFLKPYDPSFWPVGHEASERFYTMWMQGMRRQNLIFCGPSGVGKSHNVADLVLRILANDPGS